MYFLTQFFLNFLTLIFLTQFVMENLTFLDFFRVKKCIVKNSSVKKFSVKNISLKKFKKNVLKNFSAEKYIQC